MDSDTARALASTGIWGEPYLWVSLASVLIGLALGQAVRAFVRVGESPLGAIRRRPRRAARGIALLSLGILALVGLFVLSRSGSVEWKQLAIWAGAALALSALAGFRPLAIGLPLAALCAWAIIFVTLCLQGWLPYRAEAGRGPIAIARLLPYEAGPSSFRGQLEMIEKPDRDSMPVVQDASLGSGSCGICVERLSLGGPLVIAAELLSSGGETSRQGFYRIASLVAPGGLAQALALPPHLRLMDAVMSLPPEGGAAAGAAGPGAAPQSISRLLGLATRTRAYSPTTVLLTLEPVLFGLDGEGRPIILSRN